jgi:hypothetical protein
MAPLDSHPTVRFGTKIIPRLGSTTPINLGKIFSRITVGRPYDDAPFDKTQLFSRVR